MIDLLDPLFAGLLRLASANATFILEFQQDIQRVVLHLHGRERREHKVVRSDTDKEPQS